MLACGNYNGVVGFAKAKGPAVPIALQKVIHGAIILFQASLYVLWQSTYISARFSRLSRLLFQPHSGYISNVRFISEPCTSMDVPMIVIFLYYHNMMFRICLFLLKAFVMHGCI